MRGDRGRGQIGREREGAERGSRVGGGGERAPNVCNLLIEEHRKVLSSDD